MPDPLDPPPNPEPDPLNPIGDSAGGVTAQLPDLCDHWRPDPSASDDEGGPGTGAFPGAYTQIRADLPCRLLDPSSQREAVGAGAIAAVASWAVQTALGTDLQSGDAIVKSGRRFDVIDTDFGKTGAAFLTARLSSRTG